ncbi:lipase [Sphingomonas sp. DBB INV C78]|uniref:acetylxylan esterase n=1 Tax=Sphingomonas sp. DBB INV C78 TaxID=3349434 RepID=UPI0036D3CB75
MLALLPASLNAQTVTTDAKRQSVTPDMRTLPIHVGGRVKEEKRSRPAGARAFRHQWPGIYFDAAFEGRSVALKFDDTANEYRLLIDDLPPIAIAQPGWVDVKVDGLAAARHRLRLEKVTESGGVVGEFGGFYVPADATPLPVQARARQIEFIGDSSMTGFGMHSPTAQCTNEEARLRTDTQNGYAALVAKHFDADYQINAISARGVVRNYAGILPDATLPALYPYILFNKFDAYKDASWRPSVIVIKLNADFVGALNPREKWKDFNEVAKDYAVEYGAFVAALHKRQPTASFLIWWFDLAAMDPAGRAVFEEAQRAMLEAAQAAGVTRINFLPMRDLGFDRQACANHYSVDDNKRLAAWLTDYIDQHPDLWQGR